MEDSKEKMLVPEVKLSNLKKIFLVADLGLLLKKERLLLKTNSGQNLEISGSGLCVFFARKPFQHPNWWRVCG